MATKNYNPVRDIYDYFKVPRYLWSRFKSVCAKKDKSMRDILQKLVEAYVDANE